MHLEAPRKSNFHQWFSFYFFSKRVFRFKLQPILFILFFWRPSTCYYLGLTSKVQKSAPRSNWMLFIREGRLGKNTKGFFKKTKSKKSLLMKVHEGNVSLTSSQSEKKRERAMRLFRERWKNKLEKVNLKNMCRPSDGRL